MSYFENKQTNAGFSLGGGNKMNCLLAVFMQTQSLGEKWLCKYCCFQENP